MYRHLLVPIDGGELSVELVGNAVALARRLGARISFFHGAADHAHEVLAKAEAAARAFGVPCDSAHAAGEDPAQAVLAAARRQGCDLVLVACDLQSLQSLQMLQLLQVLTGAGLPVLVAAGAASRAPARAIAIIRDDHRSLAAVMHVWQQALAAARQTDAGTDPALMHSIVRYLRIFAIERHHRKEEAHLFARLRERSVEVHAELDELERQHLRDRQLLGQLAELTGKLAAATGPDRATATAALEAGVDAYADFLWEHLGREEAVILPAAQCHLSASDWSEIDQAFAEDERLGAEDERECRQLFSRIVKPA